MKKFDWTFSSLRQRSHRLASRRRSLASKSDRRHTMWSGCEVSAQIEPLEERSLLSVSSITWVEQGPGPITNGQISIPDQDNPVAGAVQTIAVHPTNSNVMVIGTVQGGIWKTTNAQDPEPVWTPTTGFAPTLGILDIAYSPLDSSVLYAGTGSFTNGGGNSPAAGVFKSTNGGDSWIQISNVDTQPFRIRAIVPTKQVVDGQQVLFAAAVQPNNREAIDTTKGGLYRSRVTASGMDWVKLTGLAGANQLPAGAVSDAKADPTDASGMTVYVVMPAQGVFRTTDGGASWSAINNGISASIISDSRNARLAINVTPSGLNLGVGFVDSNGQASGVFLFNNSNASPAWTSLGAPIDQDVQKDVNGNVTGDGNINPGKQGNRNFSLAADPAVRGVFYAGGDTGNTTAPAHIAKFDGTAWTTVVGKRDSNGNVVGGASGTSPHADSRDLEFDPTSGHLLESDDGGLYRLVNPTNPGPFFWQSANGNLRAIEVATVAYDSLNNLLVIGNQDNGGAVKGTEQGVEWRGFGGGDGNTMQVVAGPALSTHYLMQNNFKFFIRRTVDASNRLVEESAPNWNSTPVASSAQPIKLALPATPSVPLSGLLQADQDFSNAGSYAQIPFVLNRFDSDKMAIGYNGMYLATQQGDRVVEELSPAGFTGKVTAVAYGGRLSGADNPDVVYFGASDGNLYVRFGSSGALSTTTFGVQPGRGGIRDIALDPDDATNVYVVDNNSLVWRGTGVNTPSETWTNITFDTGSDRDLRTIEIYNPTSALNDEAVLVGGFSGTDPEDHTNLGGGVFYRDHAETTGTWRKVGSNLPNVLVTDVRYDRADDLLVAGTNGRGVWTVPFFSKSIGPAVTFATALGGGWNDVPSAITLADDGGYAVVGTTQSLNGDSSDIWLSRFDARGNLLWTRTYAGSFFVQLAGAPNISYGTFAFDFASDIEATADGGFVITGRSALAPGNASDGLVFQVNSVGDVVGANLHNFAHATSDGLNSVTDNGSLVAGTVSLGIEFPGPFITTYGSATYFNINGTLYGGFEDGHVTYEHFFLNQAIRRNDGGIAAIGTLSGGIYFYPYVARSGGAGGFTGVAFGDGLESGLSITETLFDPSDPNAPSYFGVLSQPGVLDINVPVTNIVRKLDAGLLPVWEVALNGTGAPGSSPGKIEALPDGGFLVATTTPYSSLYGTGSGSNIMLTKLDAAGHLVWAKAYGGRGTDGNRFNGEPVDLIVTPDGFAFTVATDSFGTDDALTTSRDFWVVKTDLDGNIPVMTGVMRDITAEVSVTPLANPSTVQHKSLAALNLTQYLPRDRTQAEIDAGIYPPVIHQELFGYGGAINDLTSTAVGVVPRVQSTPTYNSGAMQFAQANYQTDESDSSFVDVVVTRADTTHGAYGKASVNYTITPNGSTSATEFLAAPAELFQFAIPGFNSFHVDFEDGELTKAIRIRVIKDDNYEPNESITITLSDVDPLNDIALGTRTSTVVSFGDTTPFPGRAQFSASTYTVNEYKKTATITVNRVDGNGFVQVNYATVSGGTATAGSANVAGSDYESVSGTLTFDPFVTSQTFTISLFDDAATEGDETIKLQLSNVVNGELGSPILATVTIHDVELPAAQTIPTKYNGKIAFSRDVDSGILDLIVMNADGTGVTNITNTSAASESDVAWSPDGSKLAFTVFDFTDASANSGIFVSNADGTGRTRLTFSINDRLPTWSPDGSRIAYVSQGSLVLMNADGSNADSILTGSVFKPKWSPDGTHLVYQSSVGLSEIGVDGFGEREVLSAFAHVFDYSYSPNGTQLIVNGDLDDDIGNYGIYRANLNGSGTPHRLIDVTYNDFTGFSIADSTLSPDGNRLVFANQSRQILVSNVNGASQPPLTAGSTDSQPAWQPLLTDSIKPSVITLTPNPTLITDANSGTATFSITVVFDEPMNTSIKPTLAFPNEKPGSTITLNSAQSAWTNDTTFVAKYDVGTAAAFLANIDVQVFGAKDPAGNSQNVIQYNNIFNIDLRGPADTTRPTVVSFTRFNPAQAVNNAPALVFRATFSETIDFATIDTADFTVVGSTATVLFVNEVTETGDGTVYEVAVTGGNLATLSSGTVGLNVSNTANIKDLAGNLLVIAEPTIDQLYTRGASTPNRVPSFTKGANQTVLEDSGPKAASSWATAISPGTGSSDAGQTLDFIVTNNNNALFSAQPTIAPNGTLTFTPAANANGTATVTVKIHDDGGTGSGGVDTSAAQTFTITLTAVNDVPSFTLPNSSLTVLEDAVAQTVNNFVTNLSKGPANESAQKLSFVVTNDNAALFKTAPAISATGVLTYTLNPNANGVANVSVKIKDDGLVANGGVDTSAAQVFAINVTPVNDAPSFKKGADQSTNEDTAVSVANWATLISAGAPNESGQSLDFQVTNDNNGLFLVQPAIGANGTLTYTPALNASGVANITVKLHDNGGGTAPNVDLSAAQTFKITITPVNDLPTATVITPQTIAEDSSTGPISFTIGDVETPVANLTLSALSSTNTKLIPLTGITFGGSGANRTVTVTPAANQFGSSTIAFTIKDTNGGVLTQNVLITVTPVNDAPPTISNIVDVTTTEDTPTAAIKFTVDDVDDKLVNLNAITVTATSSNTNLVPNLPANIVLGGSLGARTIQLSPALDQSGTTTITVKATDSSGAFTTDTFLLTVTAVNDAPRVTAATLSISEFTTNDTPVGTVTAVDPEGAAITAYSILTGNTNNAFKIDNAGVIRVNDASKIDFETLAKYTLTIKATDAGGGFSSTAAQTGPITINVVNEFINRTVDAVDTDNTVTVLRVGNNLVARRGTVDLFSTAVEEVGTLTINGGTAKDTVILDASLNTAGTPATKKFTGQIVVNGNAGDDKLDASKITVATFGITFNGGADNDSALGGSGNETLNGGSGNDTLKGGKGNDVINGNAGNDALLGDDGDDQLNGGTDSDTLIGGLGNDTLHGNEGNDTLIGGLGADQLFGDADTDLGLGGKGGTTRGGNGAKNTGDVLDASLETINEAFATIFAFE